MTDEVDDGDRDDSARDDDRDDGERTRERLVTFALVAAWFFGGAVFLVVGPLWSAPAFTVGMLGVLQWHFRRIDHRAQLPVIPEARLLEALKRQKPPDSDRRGL